MKKIFFAIFLMLCFYIIPKSISAQTQNWEWARSIGGSNWDESTGIVTDSNGNIYVTGFFWSTSISVGTITLTNSSPGYADIFIAKYDSSGNVMWAKSFGGNKNDEPEGIVISESNELYLVGYFQSTSIAFGNDTLTNINSGFEDIFITKFSTDGVINWSKQAGGANDDVASAVAVGHNGCLYVTGNYTSPSIMLDTITLNNSSVDTTDDVFIAKYDSSGNVLWAKSAGGSNFDMSGGIVVDESNNSYITGSFQSLNMLFGQDTLINLGVSDIFIAKFNSYGSLIWAKRIGGTNIDGVSGIAIDKYDFYITGSFTSPNISFGTINLTNSDSNNINGDVYISKYDSSGNALWARSAFGTKNDAGRGVGVDTNGNCYITGLFTSPSIIFGTDTLAKASPTSPFDDIFVVKYNYNGTELWAKEAGGVSFDYGKNLSADKWGNVYVSGVFESNPIVFGNTIPLTNLGNLDIFIAKLGAQSLGIAKNYLGNKSNLYPNPFQSQAVLQTQQSLKDARLLIYDLNGKVVKKIENITGNKIVIKRSTLENGIYLLKLMEGNRLVASKKVVIVK